MRLIRLTPLLILLLSGCGLLPEQIDETRDWTASQFYYEAKENLDEGDYEEAISLYETLMSRYPIGRYTQQAQIEIAYAYYRYDEPEQAIAAADRFIKLHPQHPNVDYVYYLKGLANFNRGYGLLERFIPTDISQRDQHASTRSFYDFEELLKKFPDSKYAPDARRRMIYLRNNIAEYELAVARYYMKRAAHVAALNRASYIVEHYQRTPSVAEALEIMASAYREMGMEAQARDAERVYAMNFPEKPPTREAERPFWWPFE
ncbi:MAG: outer membrane protein assembly factor BamD [Gammaproteobacteria bacterium]|nr:outer membrane protein assembly factor BamD [Gammaproteobacteria bacterium]